MYCSNTIFFGTIYHKRMRKKDKECQMNVWNVVHDDEKRKAEWQRYKWPYYIVQNLNRFMHWRY